MSKEPKLDKEKEIRMSKEPKLDKEKEIRFVLTNLERMVSYIQELRLAERGFLHALGSVYPDTRGDLRDLNKTETIIDQTYEKIEWRIADIFKEINEKRE